MSAAHARLSPSSAKRWINCPGSVNACANLPNKSSVFANEGSRAHGFSEAGGLSSLDAHRIPGIEPDMIPHVQRYLDTIRTDYALAWLADKHAILRWEKRYALPFLPGEQFGTTDALIWNPRARLLQVFDLKYGMGVPVDPEDNEQATLYAGGAAYDLGLFEGPSFTVEIVIIQPRAPHPRGPVRRWRLSSAELSRRLEEMRIAAERTYDPAAPLVPGEWCRFCLNSGLCEAQDRANVERIQTAFGSVEAEPPAPRIDGESVGARLARFLSVFPVVEAWMRAVTAQAFNLASEGETIPGYKLVAKRGRRAWSESTPESEIERALLGQDLTRDDIYTKKLISPAQVESLLGKSVFKKFNQEAQLVVNNATGYDLVVESDKRAAIPAIALQREKLAAFAAIDLDD